MNSVRVVLAVVVANRYVTEQLDADMASLNSDFKEEVYMEVLKGIANAEKMMCKLDKTSTVSSKLECIEQDDSCCILLIGFQSRGADQCVYVKGNNGNYVNVYLNVDDNIIAAKTSREIQEAKTALKNSFRMKKTGQG